MTAIFALLLAVDLVVSTVWIRRLQRELVAVRGVVGRMADTLEKGHYP